jgi:2-C-methyl-D-erythritol 4-phosphate cytidylyltransferase
MAQDPITIPSALRDLVDALDAPELDALQAASRPQGVVGKKAKTAAIILAGGSGERFGREGGKQLVEIAGKPILTRSIEVFDAVPDVGFIVIVKLRLRAAARLSPKVKAGAPPSLAHE